MLLIYKDQTADSARCFSHLDGRLFNNSASSGFHIICIYTYHDIHDPRSTGTNRLMYVWRFRLLLGP